MALTQADKEFLQRTPDIIEKQYEYTDLTGENWPTYNYALGYENMEAWYNALTQAIEEAKKELEKEPVTFSYEEICQKIGFDPLKDPYPIPFNGHEDDSHESVFAALSPDELTFLIEYYKQHKKYD